MKKRTINDVAAKAGVSKATVSAVINSRSTVKTSTREHVLSVMKELNFRPKGFARSLKGQNIENSIGLIIRELENPFYTALAMGVKKYANSKNYVLFISSSEGKHKNEENISQIFSSKDVKGAIIAPVINGKTEIEHLFRLKTINYPFVLLEDVHGIQANVVSINNIKATKKAVKYLFDNGFTRIVHFSGPHHASHSHERISGFRNAFSESTLIFNKDMVIPCGSHFRDGYKTGLEYFRNLDISNYPMAVVCYNDVVAMGVMSALNELSIKIPEQVSIIGNDDIEFARNWNPPLTTICTPLEELGQKAAEILIKNIESDKILPVENHVLESKLIVRGTTLDYI